MADGINLFWRVRSWIDISGLPPERQARVLPFIRDWVAAGSRASTHELFQGFSQIGALRDAAVAACQPFDFVLSPVAPIASYPAEQAGWPAGAWGAEKVGSAEVAAGTCDASALGVDVPKW
jgi:aspartyl-tRNA(Asn)/glutamyl-tRNA(Gln) amidotransferase subunit A